MLSHGEFEKRAALTQHQIQWAPDNKRDPPEEIYSHYFVWHGGRSGAYIIQAFCNILLTSVKDVWTGIHLDKIGQSQPPNWTYAKCRGDVQCWIMWLSPARCRENEMHTTGEPNDTRPPLTQPETDSLNAALSFNLLTFECHGTGLHCFSSCLLIWIKIRLLWNIVIHLRRLSYMPGCSVRAGTWLRLWFLIC